MSPAAVLVFGEVSHGSGIGVTGPCPERKSGFSCDFVQPSLQRRANIFELLDVTALFALFALHSMVGAFYTSAF